MSELGLTPEQAGMAADELQDAGLVKLLRDSGSGPAGFSDIQPRPALFFKTDGPLHGWDPESDAVQIASVMLNLSGERGGMGLDEVDRHLGWGPRRLNPAADYLRARGLVQVADACGSAPYTYSYAFVTHRTRRFVEAAQAVSR